VGTTRSSRDSDLHFSKKKSIRLALIAAGGGHLREMLSLRPAFEPHDHFLITSPESRGCTEIGLFARCYFLCNTGGGRWKTQPVRFILNFFQSLGAYLRIFLFERPDCVISTGSGVAVPGFLIARVFCIRTIYVESYARVNSLSLTGRLCYALSDLFFVQHRCLADKFGRAVYAGSLYEYLPTSL
jgi:UDP-N-acetylglucosamine:LPS N-acetylglucosamine transferase